MRKISSKFILITLILSYSSNVIVELGRLLCSKAKSVSFNLKRIHEQILDAKP